jgi:hypothetical protein
MPGENYFSFIHRGMQTIFMLPGGGSEESHGASPQAGRKALPALMPRPGQKAMPGRKGRASMRNRLPCLPGDLIGDPGGCPEGCSRPPPAAMIDATAGHARAW